MRRETYLKTSAGRRTLKLMLQESLLPPSPTAFISCLDKEEVLVSKIWKDPVLRQNEQFGLVGDAAKIPQHTRFRIGVHAMTRFLWT